MFRPQGKNLAESKAGTIGSFEYDSVLQVVSCLKQPYDFLLAQSTWEFLNSRLWRNSKASLIPLEHVFIKTGDSAKYVVKGTLGKLFFFDEIEEIFLYLFV